MNFAMYTSVDSYKTQSLKWEMSNNDVHRALLLSIIELYCMEY